MKANRKYSLYCTWDDFTSRVNKHNREEESKESNNKIIINVKGHQMTISVRSQYSLHYFRTSFDGEIESIDGELTIKGKFNHHFFANNFVFILFFLGILWTRNTVIICKGTILFVILLTMYSIFTRRSSAKTTKEIENVLFEII